MRWFFSRTVPPISRLLLVESGPRNVTEEILPRLRERFGKTIAIDLLTCQSDDPIAFKKGNAKDAQSWCVADYQDANSRWDFLCSVGYRYYSVCVVLCANSPIMLPWKLSVLLMLPSKFVVVNENADCFLLDYKHLSDLKNLCLHRVGVQPDLTVRLLARALIVPFTLTHLLVYATIMHARRLVRIVFRTSSES